MISKVVEQVKETASSLMPGNASNEGKGVGKNDMGGNGGIGGYSNEL